MFTFLVNNYLTIFAGCFIATLTLVWTVHEKFISSAVAKSKHRRRTFIVQLILSLLIALPASLMSGNFIHQKTKEDLIMQLSKFRQDLISKVKKTEDDWAKSGYLKSAPPNVPWPLLLDTHEFEKWAIEFKVLFNQINKYFTPQSIEYCHETLILINRPHVATYFLDKTVNKKFKLIVEHSFSHKQVDFLNEALTFCSDKISSEASLTFIPKLRLTSKEQLTQFMNVRQNENKGNYQYWLSIAEISNNERKRHPNEYFSTAIGGFSLFLTNREDRGAKLMEEALSMVLSKKEKIDMKDELPLIMCSLLYKYYHYLSPDNNSGQNHEKGNYYKDLGVKIGGKRFEEIFSSMLVDGFGDSDFKWHYKEE